MARYSDAWQPTGDPPEVWVSKRDLVVKDRVSLYGRWVVKDQEIPLELVPHVPAKDRRKA